MTQAVKAQEAYEYHRLNLKFHDRLIEMTGNRKLTSIYRKFIKELSLFRRRNLAEGWLMPVSAGEHQKIVQAIATGDRSHILSGPDDTLESHLMVFAAERARREGRVVPVELQR